MDRLIDELKKKKQLFIRVEGELSSPEVLADHRKYQRKAKEYADLKKVVNEYDKLESLLEEERDVRRLLEEEHAGSECTQLAEEELDRLAESIAKQRVRIEDILLDGQRGELRRNVIMEIRAGTGGLEASLFASDLFRMYAKYAESRNWKVQILSSGFTEAGGIKEAVFSVEGEDVFKYLQFEMGTHRVQRVPETEAGGRIHTSAATVAVLPEADDISEVDIKGQDVKMDVYRSSGAGGQHVNVTDSAVRLTHLPTGIVVCCQDERSQHKNRAKAMRVLKARILEQKQRQQQDKMASTRRKQVGSGDRSEKIRTYNFPENRLTDHRIGLTIHDLGNIIEGALDPVIEALLTEDRKLRLSS